MDRDVTTLLLEWTKGNLEALDQLTVLVYKELRRLAARHLQRERSSHTLQCTALVHETYLQLVDQRAVQLVNRNQFFALASRIMRNVLVSYARAHKAAKRGGGNTLLRLDKSIAEGGRCELDLVALDDAIEQLVRLDPRQARIVELRFFTGLSIQDTANILNISPATVKRDWELSRAWLYRQLDGRTEHRA
jgi:RNA polymerase sigma factor (TIGR02999 family)